MIDGPDSFFKRIFADPQEQVPSVKPRQPGLFSLETGAFNGMRSIESEAPVAQQNNVGIPFSPGLAAVWSSILTPDDIGPQQAATPGVSNVSRHRSSRKSNTILTFGVQDSNTNTQNLIGV